MNSEHLITNHNRTIDIADKSALLDSQVNQLVESQLKGYTLDQSFYTDDDIFTLEKERVVYRQWQFCDHVSRIPNEGDYFLFRIAGEEIIIVRDKGDKIRAHYNVCRHRGSRLCLSNSGTKRSLTCPYHAWSYNLDGTLNRARQMPEGFDASAFSLHSCPVRVFEGLMFIYLGEPEEAPDFAYIANMFEPWFETMDFAQAKVVAVEEYPTPANWKLVVENFLECYHCRAGHPEYSATMGHVSYDGDGTKKGQARYRAMYEEWLTKAKSLGRKVGCLEPPCPDQTFRISRQVIKQGSVSTTEDGQAACAKLLGSLTERDGGDTFAVFGDNLYFLGTDDYVALLRITPTETMHTDVSITWLVHTDAVEGVDYDLEKLKWLWHVTTQQDAELIINNQKGICSKRYSPGPYSTLETYCVSFVENYLSLLSCESRKTTQMQVNAQDYTSEEMWEA